MSAKQSWHFVTILSSVEASKLLPNFVEMDLQGQTLPGGILLEHLKAFQNLYREHCEVGSWQHFSISPSLTFSNITGDCWLQQSYCVIWDTNYLSYFKIKLFLVNIVKIKMKKRCFWCYTRPFSQAVLDVMVNLQFTLVGALWKSFWRFSQSNDTESISL